MEPVDSKEEKEAKQPEAVGPPPNRGHTLKCVANKEACSSFLCAVTDENGKHVCKDAVETDDGTLYCEVREGDALSPSPHATCALLPLYIS